MDISRICTRLNPPVDLRAVTEIPVGGVVLKHEFDQVLFYPGNYGFIPRARSEDGDRRDVPIVGQAQ